MEEIIDSVNVADCVMFRDDVFLISTNEQLHNVCSIGLWQRDYQNLDKNCVMSCSCKDNPNCNFKQLARRTAECEELKERIKCNCFDSKSNNNRCISYNRIAEDYARDLKRLEKKTAECEELKSQLEAYSKMLDSTEFRVALTDVKTGEREVWRKLGNKAQRYEQALDDIAALYRKAIEDITTYDNAHDVNISIEALHNISDIVTKAKGDHNV